MIADGNLFNSKDHGPQMHLQESVDSEALDEIQRKIQDNEYELDMSDTEPEPKIEDASPKREDLFFATEIEAEFKREAVS